MLFKKIFFFSLICIIFSRTLLSQNKTSAVEFNKAYDYFKKQNYRDALKIMQNASQKDKSQLSAELVIKGFVFTDSLSFDSGKVYFEKAQKLFTSSTNEEVICQNYFGFAQAYFYIGDFKTAIKYSMEMDKYGVKFNLLKKQRVANSYLAINYLKLKQIPISINYARRAIKIAKTLKDSSSIFYAYCSLAAGFLEWGNSDHEYIKKYGDSILKTINEFKTFVVNDDNTQMANLFELYGKAYLFKNNSQEATKYFTLSLKYFILTNDTFNINEVCENMAGNYIELKKYDSALFYLKKSEVLSISPKTASDHRLQYNYFYKVYKALNETKLSLKYLEKYVEQNDEINYGVKKMDLQKLREDFEIEKTNQLITSEKEKTEALYEQKRNFYFNVAGGILLVLFLISYLIYYKFKTNREKEKRNLQLLLQKAELTALKSQMNPHFIFNALNSIQHSIVTNNTDDAYKFLAKFSKLIRNVLDSSSEQTVPLKTEIETLSLYIDLESKRFDNSFSYKINLNENGFPANDVMIPTMILQPFIENAIWHGLMPKENEKKLEINFKSLSQDTLLCEIADNGIGRDKAKKIAEEKKKNHKSKGIANILDRVKLFEMTHLIKINIEITDIVNGNDLQCGTKVSIQFNKIITENDYSHNN